MVYEYNNFYAADMYDEIEKLRKKLLDMSLRNNLLNFRVLKRTIPIVDESIVEVFKILVINGKTMEFLPKEEEEFDLVDSEDEVILDDYLDDRENIWTIEDYDLDTTDKYTDRYLQTNLTEKALQKGLFNLFQNYKTSITEQGFNNIYLALGFLEWNDSEYEDKIHKAPIILIPVEISRASVGSPFKIQWDQGDLVPNISLQNKLMEQNVVFPIFEELDTEEELCDYFSRIRESISHKSGWNISSEIYLSTFSFKKFVMYKDLDLLNWSKDSAEGLNRLLFDPEDVELDSYETFELDEIPSEDLFQVLDADSSQMEVIENVKKGNNLVVEGPPGTGKSQTIVNLIAELMANNKTILFVSEKMAALEVVKRRLDSVGLGSGCLELHSNKSKKRAVLDEINNTLNEDFEYYGSNSDFEELNDLKLTLNSYIGSLYEVYGDTELYPYQLFGIKEKEEQFLLSKNQEIYYFDIDNLYSYDPITQRNTLSSLNDIEKVYELIAPINKNPWKNIKPIDFPPNKIQFVKNNLEKLSSNLESLINISNSLSSSLHCPNLEYLRDFNDYDLNLSVIRPGLSILNDERSLDGLINDIEKYQSKLNSLDLEEKIPSSLFLIFNSLKSDLTQLISCLDDLSLSYNCSYLTSLSDFNQYTNNLSILEPNLKTIDNKYDLSNLVSSLETYNQNIDSLDLMEELPKSIENYSEIIDRLINNILMVQKESNSISDSVHCSKLLSFGQTEEWIGNLNILNPKMKVVDKKDDLISIIDNVKEFQSNYDNFTINNYSDDLKSYEENLFNFLNNVQSLKMSLDDFYNVTGVKINDLKSIDWILDKTILLKRFNVYEIDDDLESLINAISQYQHYAKDLDAKIFDLDLESKLSEVNTIIDNFDNLSIDSNLIFKENIGGIKNQFISNNSSNSVNSSFNAENSILVDLKKKALRYSAFDLDNNLIIKDFDRAIELEQDANSIKDQILKFSNLDINSLEDLQFNLVNLIILKDLFVYIKDNDDLGKKYFGNYWNSYESDVDVLLNQYKSLSKLNEISDFEIFNEEVLEKLSSVDNSLLKNSSNEILDSKNEIISNFKDMLISFGGLESSCSMDIGKFYYVIKDLYDELLILKDWESFKSRVSSNKMDLLTYDLDDVENSIKAWLDYSNDSIFTQMQDELINVLRLRDLNLKLENHDSLAKNYFGNLWKGSSSNIDELEKHSNQLIKFNRLLSSKFYTNETLAVLSSLNFLDLNHRIDNVNSLIENIFIDFDVLLSIVNNVNVYSMDLSELIDKLRKFSINFSDIKDWFNFKSTVGINDYSNLYHYNFNKLKDSVNNLLYYFTSDDLNKILVEVSNLEDLSNLKDSIDSNVMGKKYFPHMWEGASSDLDEIHSFYEKLNDFNNLLVSKFFSKDTEKALSDMGTSKLNGLLLKLNNLKENIFKNINSLNSLNIFKEKIENLEIKDLFEKISYLDSKLTVINDWQKYKDEKKNLHDNNLNDLVLDLFEYDLKEVKDTYLEISQEANFNDNLKNELNNISMLKNIKLNVDKKDDLGLNYFNNLWENVNSDIESLYSFFNDLIDFNKLLGSGFYSADTLSALEILDFDDFNSSKNELLRLYDKINDSYYELNGILDFDSEFLDDSYQFKYSLNELKSKLDVLIENSDILNSWRLFYSYAKENENTYLKNILPLIWDDKVQVGTISSLFNFNIANNLLNEIIDENPSLRNFDQTIFDEMVDKFKKLDNDVLEVNRQRIKSILYYKRPNAYGSSISPYSQLGILTREIGKKSKIMPIRKLLSEAIDVIGDIKPCFMMSPISVAQYLDPHVYSNHFDYVIFDEASQVRTEDAIGAFLRGKNFVIMGDSKQLPPTNFFNSDNDMDDDDSIYSDVESILKLCKSVFPDKMLKWHYRSRHESLIAVSNMEFYNNNLVVFPSPFNEREDLGLKLIHNPDNYYDKGGSSKNIGEARDVIEYAINHFKQYGKTKSLGIGTFSIKQKQAILEELEYRLRKNPNLEPYFDESGENGFFIKNLENIQGDERDVILISTGYGFDRNKKLTMNFGPLNHKGGERRLNVLITRARERCVVFSNFLSKDLNVKSNSSLGLKAFKTFIYYAEHNEFPKNMPTGKDFDSPFEESVYNFLVDNGYIVEKQVGCAGYRLDLAIVDPDNADKYVLGIECDGATFHSSATARDRDRLRQEVLERLGWKFHRIWSTDWFYSRKYAQEKLIEVVEEALRNKDIGIINESGPYFEDSGLEDVEENTKDDLFDYYVYFKYDESLDDYDYDSDLIGEILVRDLIKFEQPVHIDDIYDSMKEIFREERKTQSFKRMVDSLIEFNINEDSVYNEGDFYYHESFDKNSFKPRYRRKAKLERISDDEIKLAIVNTLKISEELSKKDLIKESSNNLGFNAVRKNIKERFASLIYDLINEGQLMINDKNNLILDTFDDEY